MEKSKKILIFLNMLKDLTPNTAIVVAQRRLIPLLRSWPKEYRLIQDCLWGEMTKHIWGDEINTMILVSVKQDSVPLKYLLK